MSRRYWLGTRYSDEAEPPVVPATPEQMASDELRRRDPKAWREALAARMRQVAVVMLGAPGVPVNGYPASTCQWCGRSGLPHAPDCDRYDDEDGHE